MDQECIGFAIVGASGSEMFTVIEESQGPAMLGDLLEVQLYDTRGAAQDAADCLAEKHHLPAWSFNILRVIRTRIQDDLDLDVPQ